MAEDGSWTQSPLSKSITPELRTRINEACKAKPGDILAFQFGKAAIVHTVMAKLRVDVAKKIIKLIKESKLKVQAQIQGEEIRVTGKARDDLQAAMALVRGGNLGQPFQFKNFRD